MPKFDYDIAIIGGGLSGLGIARAAAYHGFKALLVERGQFGQGTTSASLRIIHGGFRYLQTLDLPRVLNSIQAADDLLQRYPDIISPLPCLLPLKKLGFQSAIPVRIALQIYRGLLKAKHAKVLESGRILASEDITIPFVLKAQTHFGALTWWDGLLKDPNELVKRVSAEAVSLGSTLYDETEATKIELDSDKVGVDLKGSKTAVSRVLVRVDVDATGGNLTQVPVSGVIIPKQQFCLGYNLVISRQLDGKFGIASRSDKRLLFAVPRGQGTAVGTWYLPDPRDSKDKSSLKIPETEISKAVSEINAAFPGVNLREAEILSYECGLLPLGTVNGDEIMPLGREQFISRGRYIGVVSTKLTTFAQQAERVLTLSAKFLGEYPFRGIKRCAKVNCYRDHFL